jgi:hypothetical protein
MSETFKKRQKEAARKEKQLKKSARRLARRNEKPKIGIVANGGSSETPTHGVPSV